MDNMLLTLLGLALVLGLGLLVYIAFANRKPSRLDRKFYQDRWQHIENLFTQGETGWQLAIFEADKLLDKALQDNGFPGKTVGDRMKDARSTFRNNDHIWQAHKLRNRLAHEHDVRLNTAVVRRALMHFKAAIKDLGAL